ncbi:FecR family protein [Maribacter aquivivus]|uniref:FecR family protein n=1 Tax=Maribacter aquivivus TaxID=228958 RepID=A0A1M6QNQ3_9FLAO|nr:FecR domain-containing protein [Maribacter aquivivus]SHK21846.1 FecR family protein [Maribacter aquivivus]
MSKHLEDKNLIARWMDDRLSNEEKEQLKESGELDALKTVIDDIDTWKVKPFNLDAGLAKLTEENKTVVPLKKSNKNWLRIAASVAILLSCSLVWYLTSTSSTTIATKIAESKTVELPTGSLVELDAASSITYNKDDWEDSRILTLSGQAFFNVTSGAPFIVKTPTAQVSVLGTQFNISTQKEQFSVYCYEGKIEVSYKNNSEIITKGQSVFLVNGKLKKDKHEYLSPEWMNGLSTYDRTPLKTVIADVKRYYNVEVNLPKKYGTLQFTGTIAHKDLQQTLNTIFTTMEIKYELQEDNTVIFE